MTLEEFTETINNLWDEGDDKGATLLAQEFQELYEQYSIEHGLVD